MAAKDTFFSIRSSIRCKGSLLKTDTPLVMGVLNATADSFYDGGLYQTPDKWLAQAGKLLREGSAIIDIGVMSTRPGALEIPEAEEAARLAEVVGSVSEHYPSAIISADTYRPGAAEAALKAGASIINDISGGSFHPEIFGVAAAYGAPMVLMHIRGRPENMQDNPEYDDVVNEVIGFLARQAAEARRHGVNDILADPGFGFGKALEHNYTLLSHLEDFKILGMPVVAGFSRKSMVNKVIGSQPGSALNGTTVLNTIALMKGAKILRVHDAKEAREAIQIWKMLSF
jgi:dihydropteroate synthase